MTSVHIRHPESRHVSPLYGAAALVVLAAVLAASLGAGRDVRVTVDGVQRSLPAKSTVADLVKRDLIRGEPGDLLAADGSGVAKADAGRPVVVVRNGRLVRADQRLYNGDVIRSEDGVDITESVIETELPVPMPVEVSGTGSIEVVVREGAEGVKVATVGAVSGVEITSTVTVAPKPRVMQRMRSTGGGMLVALTFDDGPWDGQTKAVLDILKAENAPATFFMVGRRATLNKDLVKRMVAEGHQLGNHTLGHALLDKVTPTRQTEEIAQGVFRIQQVAGEKPKWFRPPGGHMTPWAYKAVSQSGMRIAMWDVDPNDWRKPPAYVINQRVFANTRPGSVILLHDGGGDRSQTIAALPGMIRELRRRGFTFVTLDELAAAGQANAGK